ncbi:MAG: hypothetical protein AAGM38_15920 [Pseudomonadota bacterium]
MLDAMESLPRDTEDAAVENSQFFPAANAMACFAPWNAAAQMGPAAQRVMAASMMMAPFAMARANMQSIRKARALAAQWGEELARTRSMDAAIDVNRRYGEKAIALGAGEMWRVLEHSVTMGRASAAPESLSFKTSAKRG